MTIDEYIKRINTKYKSGYSREHSYRGDLQNLLESLSPGILVTNEPAHIACGAPDYILTKGKIPVGYIEAKDIGEDLSHKKHKEQFSRYRSSLSNLIITDYINFWLYRNNERVATVQIAKIKNSRVVGIPEKYEEFKRLIKDFTTLTGQTIKSAKRLAEIMANKARLLADIIEQVLINSKKQESGLHGQMKAFKEILIHDIEPRNFADIYAQTIAYGMFAARLNDPTLEDFSRQEAASLIPKSNPFLRKLFQYIAGYDLDERIKWIVDALADVFRATDVSSLLKDFGKATQQNDPMIHFYETFLAEYDPKLRKSRGVYYTPEPVVNFIVRAVNDILKKEFKLKDGLADISKTKIKIKSQNPDKRTKTGFKEIEQEVHKVQILDPAAGTGTFLAEVVKQIYKKFKNQQGIWNNYVDKHLLPRLNGFELLMAPYAMAHLKLELLLTKTGYKPKNKQRLNVYLTNSLEEHHPDTGTLFANWLSTEANEANHIKRDTPVMVVIGNPPYSGESTNKGDWIMNLLQDYKKEPGGKERLKEQNSKFINDDYVKFLRYGQYFIEKNGEGILAFINPHGFLDNPTFRGMRWNLLKTYDKIFTIDLHGNAKKKEVSPDGLPDVNVFDIMQGVSINIFVKTGNKKDNELGKIFHYDLYGKRKNKYQFLWNNNINSVSYVELSNVKPYYFFVQKDFKVQIKYDKYFSIIDLFKVNSLGIQTHRDALSIDENIESLKTRIKEFYNKTIENEILKEKYSIKENSEWKLSKKRNGSYEETKIVKIAYRPFDTQYIYYDNNIVDRLRNNVSKHFINHTNICLVVPRQCVSDWRYSFISKNIIESNLTGTAGRFGAGYFFPLYLYPGQKIDGVFTNNSRKPNLNTKTVEQIAKKLQLIFSNEKEIKKTTFTPINVLDYIYAVLHSPTYREKYKEFLKIDFPRVPYPKDKKTFWQLVDLGKKLRKIHLLESPKVKNYITSYPKNDDNVITRNITKKSPGFKLTKKKNKTGRVWINDQQYFDKVPLIAWEFYIGGYQPAQKWLKDRKGRKLSFEDIQHYQKIIVALFETDKLMKEIDKIDFM